MLHLNMYAHITMFYFNLTIFNQMPVKMYSRIIFLEGSDNIIIMFCQEKRETVERQLFKLR